MRRSDHPNRPSATIWWCLSSAKTLLMPRRNAAFPVGVNASSRYSKWPVFSCPLMAGFGCPPRSTEPLTEQDLVAWTEHSNASVYRRDILRPLHRDRFIEYNE